MSIHLATTMAETHGKLPKNLAIGRILVNILHLSLLAVTNGGCARHLAKNKDNTRMAGIPVARIATAVMRKRGIGMQERRQIEDLLGTARAALGVRQGRVQEAQYLGNNGREVQLDGGREVQLYGERVREAP